MTLTGSAPMAVDEGIQIRATQNRQPNEAIRKDMRLSPVADQTQHAAPLLHLPAAARNGLYCSCVMCARRFFCQHASSCSLADLLLFAVADGLQLSVRNPQRGQILPGLIGALIAEGQVVLFRPALIAIDRKSTRLNSSHLVI